MDKITELLERGVENIIPSKTELEKVLRSGRKLNVYLGIDPTFTSIHIGHAVPLRKLQQFVELDHHVTFLIGDFTALIGDTSDKLSERPILTSEEIEKNFQTYREQAAKILDFTKVTVRHNSEWLKELNFKEIIQLCQHFSVGDFISRELIKKRMEAGTKVRLDEVLYPVMQGYDSYFMNTDIQVGGTDQTFNMQAGRTLIKDLRNKQSFVLATGFLEGTDGRKMSKSWNNAIWITDEPQTIYGKVMSLKDDLIVQYFMLATDVSWKQIQEVKARLKDGENPIVLKKELAKQIVSELHSAGTAQKAQGNFERVVQQKEIPEELQEIRVEKKEISVIDFLVTYKLVSSKSEAKRLIEQGGVEVEGKKITNHNIKITPKNGMIIRVGKRRFVKTKI